MEIVLTAILTGCIVALILLRISHKKRETQQAEGKEHEQRIQPQDHLPHYTSCKLSVSQNILYAGLAMIVLYGIGYIFYQHWLISAVFSLLGLLYPRIHRRHLLNSRKKELSHQFQQALFSLSTSLVAGRSVENAFREVVDDLKMIYPHPKTLIIKEFEWINRRIQNGESVEKVLHDFSMRAGIEDIEQFKDVFVICKRSGGELIEVMRRTANIIGDKLEIERDIQVMLAQKKLEARMLSVAPFVMIGLLSYLAADYMAPLYEWSAFGPLVMTGCLALLVCAFWLSQRLMQIDI